MPHENDSLLGLTLDQMGKPVVQTTHRDGSVETHPLDPTTRREGTAPHTWRHAGPALERNPAAGLTRSERVEQSLRVEASLVKTLHRNPSQRLTDAQCRLVLREVLAAMGGEWEKEAKCL